MYCSQCGHSNADGATTCSKCGAPLQHPAATPASAGITPSAGSGHGFDAAAFEAAVGKSGAGYYNPRFAAMARGEGKVSWHWPAFFVTWYWLLYRKMYGWSALYFFLPWLLAIPLGLLVALSPKAGPVLTLGYLVVFWTVPPLLANTLYYRHCRALVDRSTSSGGSRERSLAFIEAKGGTSNIAFIIIGVFGIVALIGILAAIALPAYQDYTYRARVAEAVAQTAPIKAGVAEHFARTGRLPDSLDEFWTRPSGTTSYLREVTMEPKTGVLELTVRLNPQGRTITMYMVPSVGAGQTINWQCMAPADVHKYVPMACRHDVN